MLAPIGPTLDTTYMLQIRRTVDGGWFPHSPAEYTTAEDVTAEAKAIYGGAFAAPDMHRVIKVERTIVA